MPSLKFSPKKSIFFVGFFLAAAAFLYASLDLWLEPQGPRMPASVAANYEALGACEKQEILWSKIQDSVYRELPDFRSFGPLQLLAMGKQEVSVKGRLQSDFAPPGWRKYIHGRGVIAKVRLVPRGGAWTGVFQGADCALLRLSLTFKPKGSRAVAPGLALKVLRDGLPSANVSALVSLEGQEKDFNFFKNPLSNIVPIGSGLGQRWVHRIFRKASDYPEELLMNDLAGTDSQGKAVTAAVPPRQIFFVPNPGLTFPSEEHDVRADLLKIPAGTAIYQIRALPRAHGNFDYADYSHETAAGFLAASEAVADLVTTSEFLASEFGDDGIFFRHELR